MNFRNANTPIQGAVSRLTHSATHSTLADVHDIIEVDEDGDIENVDSKPEIDVENVQQETSPNLTKKDDFLSPNKEVNTFLFCIYTLETIEIRFVFFSVDCFGYT